MSTTPAIRKTAPHTASGPLDATGLPEGVTTIDTSGAQAGAAIRALRAEFARLKAGMTPQFNKIEGDLDVVQALNYSPHVRVYLGQHKGGQWYGYLRKNFEGKLVPAYVGVAQHPTTFYSVNLPVSSGRPAAAKPRVTDEMESPVARAITSGVGYPVGVISILVRFIAEKLGKPFPNQREITPLAGLEDGAKAARSVLEGLGYAPEDEA